MNNNISTASSVNFAQEFITFIKKFGIIGLAFGVVIGGAVKQLVDDFSTFVLKPLIDLILSKIGNVKPGSLPDFGVKGLDIGGLVASCISFVVLMFIVFTAAKFVLAKFISKEELDAMK
jgi:large-conductance mechanosensitive channel